MSSLGEKMRDFAFSISSILLNQQWLSDAISLKGAKVITVVEERRRR
jgi:hypothetical protein